MRLNNYQKASRQPPSRSLTPFSDQLGRLPFSPQSLLTEVVTFLHLLDACGLITLDIQIELWVGSILLLQGGHDIGKKKTSS